MRSAIVNTFLGHISQINSLSEQVTWNWSFRRCDSQPLGQYTDKVWQSGAMPQKHVVSKFLIVNFLLIWSHDFENVTNFNLSERSFSVFEILNKLLVILWCWFDWLNFATKFFVILIMNGFFIVGLLIKKLGCNFHVWNCFKHFQFLLDFFIIIKDKISHFLKPEIMGN